MPTVGTCPNCMADLIGRHQRACLTCGEQIPLEVRLIEVPIAPPVAEPSLELVAEPEPAPLDVEPPLPDPDAQPEAAPAREIDWQDEQPESPAPSRKRRFFRR